MPWHWQFSVRSARIGHLPVVIICLLTFVTTLHAAALNRTGQEASQLLPAYQLQPDDVQKGAHESKVNEVNCLSFGISWSLWCDQLYYAMHVYYFAKRVH